MKEKKYWKGLEEKYDQLPEEAHHEFPEKLPVLGGALNDISNKPTGRRDFLKMLGFSVGAAAVAASCEMPLKKSIPYINKPEEITPGMPNYYSTSLNFGGDHLPVLVKTREGRPIKIEGHPGSVLSGGGTSARAQAAVLGLYDGARYKTPMANGSETDWETLDKEVGEKLGSIAQSGGKIVILSSTVHSPSTLAAIADFKAKYPSTEHVMYDAISYAGILDANKEQYGQRAIPHYQFDKASVIVGIGCDFLGSWHSPVEYANSYSKTRKVSVEHPVMSRHYQIESVPTITGSAADVRIPVKPSEEVKAAVALYNAIVGGGPNAGFEHENLTKAANDLKAAKGKGIVVSGSNNKDVQLVVNAINEALGNYGSTITWDHASNTKKGDDKKLDNLMKNISNVKALIVIDANPAYNLPGLKDAMANMELTVSLSDRKDETSEASQYIATGHHLLECWGDANPRKGIYGTIQPAISPLFDTRQAEETLLRWGGNSTSYYDYIRANWEATVLPAQSKYSSFDILWDNAIHDGEIVVSGTVATHTPAAPSVSANEAGDVAHGDEDDHAEEHAQDEANMVAAPVAEEEVEEAAAPVGGANASSAASVALSSVSAAGSMELKLYEKVGTGDGYWATNPWIMELPDPVTRIAWDNYVVASPAWVRDNGLMPNSKNRRYSFVKVSTDNGEVSLPVVPVPGMPNGAFGIAYGYGREAVIHDELKHGASVYPMVTIANGIRSDVVLNASVSADSKSDKLAIVQQHHTLTHETLGGEKTRLIVKETSLEEYREDPWSGNTIGDYRRDKWIEHHLKTMYGNHDKQGHHWGMVIDLNTCIGCAACVVACNAENNIPVVGKDEVRRAHEMHWLRIDRYHTGDEENPQVVFQPMLCQHCDNAPCENVCPVAATNHSSEGLNQMAYNRCIGTRYCANNCPYKVRRFNWLDYNAADSFYDGTFFANDAKAPQNLGMHSELTRMVLNPDVTVRGRGVIEKCSFCVQRIQAGKLEAKKDGRKLADGEIKTACQSACPTDGIVFGDMNDPESKVAIAMKNERAFGVIEEIHTLPSVNYLTKVRNVSPEEVALPSIEPVDHSHGAH